MLHHAPNRLSCRDSYAVHVETDYKNGSKTRKFMKKVILEGQLGEKFGSEWNLDVRSPAEAMHAIMSQRPGMRQYLAESEGIQGYEVLVDGASIEDENELLINNPGQGGYTFVPVIGGSKSSGLMMILELPLIAMTGGLGAGFAAPFMSGAGAGGLVGGAAGTGLGTLSVTSAGTTAITLGKAGTALSYLELDYYLEEQQ